MPDIYAALNRLQPPISYQLDQEGELFTLMLSDTKLGVQAIRSMSPQEYQNPDQLRIIVLYAINEMRVKGSVVLFAALPFWD
ncbi:hypothetical protein EWW49_25980 [Pseudomonas syringae]|uniref:hypothetical protein n=1 Tax=Pseudomonas sp. MWU16-30316 TaxID=2878093 RepID=UPI0011035A16|nr:hypothetical protein [Pseudomonas sp. MWU16-30316]TFZ34278.1 hypothetical protein EWW49_25980 [Pseudomonas syringae]